MNRGKKIFFYVALALLILVIPIFIFGILSKEVYNHHQISYGDPIGLSSKPIPKLANPDSIYFQFSLDTVYNFLDQNQIVINCKLLNTSSDTIYLFTHSCYKYTNDFIIQTEDVQTFVTYSCCASTPIIEKVAPKNNLKFKANFLAKKRVRKIDFHFYIYQVDSDFDIHNSDSIGKLQKTIINNIYNVNSLDITKN